MKHYLLLFVTLTLLLFALPKSSSMRSFTQQVELKKGCRISKHFGKGPCAKKCLRHQTHSGQKDNASGIALGCSQQVYAVVNELHPESPIIFETTKAFVLPLVQKHLSPVLEYDPEPPRLS
ncbi:hypothetical protein [Pontibacter litorisediminis]|uniref:hypothetical protein n=1 Tax=Pontibacter litorisediminis TaxID=1846260 RepID=UPI0023ED1A74|nr:hypothetical protein [Pontibacter litorisediminis]